MIKRRWLISIGVALVVALGLGKVLLDQPQLPGIHQEIVANYADVNHLEPADFAQQPQAGRVIFDVREQEEYEVSHIEGAIHVEPGISPEEFAQRYGQQLVGKDAVFYCSVGRRSSELVSRVQDTVRQQGGKGAYNLIGGVFQWRNESRPLVNNEAEPTQAVHPYNRYWGRLLDNQASIRFQPE